MKLTSTPLQSTLHTYININSIVYEKIKKRIRLGNGWIALGCWGSDLKLIYK